MLSEADIDSFDGCPQRFHHSEDESIAKDEGQKNVQKDSRVVDFGMISIPVMDQHCSGEHDSDPRHRASHARAHVSGNIFVNHGFNA